MAESLAFPIQDRKYHVKHKGTQDVIFHASQSRILFGWASMTDLLVTVGTQHSHITQEVALNRVLQAEIAYILVRVYVYT